MHLVDVTLFYSPTSGGVRRYLSSKHAWLSGQSGVRHSLLVPGEETQLRPGDVSTIRGGKVPGAFNYRLPLSPPAWTRMLEALEPDAIEVGDAFHTAWTAAGVAQRRGIPLTAFFHSNLPELIRDRCGSLLGRGAQAYVRWLYSRFDCVFAPSRFVREYLDSIGIHHVVLQPLGVDVDVFNPAKRTRDLRRELGLRRDARLLVYAGRFSGEKNIDVIVEAFRRLGAPYEAVLIGGGESRTLERNVRVVPYCRDSAELASWLASADAFVHAGTTETFGLGLLEAMACGRPVVATRAGAVPEYTDEHVGRLAEPYDAEDLARAIASLYASDLDALGAAARERVVRRYTWSRALTTQLATYAALSGHGPIPVSAASALGTAPLGSEAFAHHAHLSTRESSNSVSFPLRSPTAM